jgi:HD domain
MTRVRHLAQRFFGSVRAEPLDDVELELVRGYLGPDEFECWERLGPADRRESVETARATLRALGSEPEPDWVAAALLHDVGKVETDLGPVGRSVATVSATVVGRRRARSWTNRFGRYVNHDDLGALRLRVAGARPAAVSWAAAHHRPELWPTTGIPLRICRILATADGEPDRR